MANMFLFGIGSGLVWISCGNSMETYYIFLASTSTTSYFLITNYNLGASILSMTGMGSGIWGDYCLEVMTTLGFPLKMLLRIRSILVTLSILYSLL
jgi:cytochrome c biogenesis protein CcdA